MFLFQFREMKLCTSTINVFIILFEKKNDEN